MKTQIVTFPKVPTIDSPEFGEWLKSWYASNQVRSPVESRVREAIQAVAKRVMEEVPVMEVEDVTPAKIRRTKVMVKEVKQVESKREKPPQVAQPMRIQTAKTRQRLDAEVVFRHKIEVVQMCGTCRTHPALEHGYCEGCWKMWIERKVTGEK